MAADVVRNYKIRYSVEDKAKGPITSLGTVLTNTSGTIQKFTTDLSKVSLELDSVGRYAGFASKEILALNAALNGLPKRAANDASQIAGGFGRIDFNAQTATRSVGAFNAEAATMGNVVGGINNVQAAVQKTQRSTYGLWQNAAQANQALGQIANQANGINSVGTAASGLGANLKVTSESGKAATGSLGGLMVAMMALNAADTVVRAVGDSIKQAREDTEGWARETLKLRDELRELANLQGKPGADDQVVGKHLNMRLETGMSSAEARKFDEQFRGSLPLAKDAGGINDATAEKLAPEVGKLAVRTGLDGGTAGDLAGSLGTFGKVPDAEVGLGQAQQVVDLLNDGRGNLTPLTKELMKDAAATVGDGKMFGTLQERAAAVSTSTAMGAIGRSSTRINQAIAGLSGFDKDQGDTLRDLGVKDTDDFLARIEKVKPLVDEAKAQGKDPLGYLSEKGFHNQVEQKAILGFVENIDSLRRKTDSVREDPNAPDAKARAAGQRSSKLNADFLTNDKAARNRIAGAKVDAAQLQRGVGQENYLIEKQEAEARLIASKDLDTPEANLRDAVVGGFGLSEKLTGKSGRDIIIDNEIRKKARDELAQELGRPLTKDEADSIDNRPPSFAADYLANLRKRQSQKAQGQPPANPGLGGVGGPVKKVAFQRGMLSGPMTQDLVYRPGQNPGFETDDLVNRGGSSGLVRASIEVPGSRSGMPTQTPPLIDPSAETRPNQGLAMGEGRSLEVLEQILDVLKRPGGRPAPLPGPRPVYADRSG